MPVNNPIKIYGDPAKGCIFFEGSRVDPKFLGTVQADLHPSESGRIIICRNDRFQTDGITKRRIFRRLNVMRIQNEDGEYLVEDLGLSPSGVVDYINAEASKSGSGSNSLTYPGVEVMDFTIDDTKTSVLFSNGHHFGVNAIVAVEGDDGLVKIKPAQGDLVLYSLDKDDVRIDGVSPAATLSGVVNALNSLFAVSALGSGATPPPFFTVDDGSDVTINLGTKAQVVAGGLIGPNTGSPGQHGAHVWTDETIDEPGEYFTFRIRGGESQIGFGLYSVADGDVAELESNSGSGHSGIWYSNWFHPTPNGPWTNYGSKPWHVAGPGWTGPMDQRFSNSPAFDDWAADQEVLIKVGITEGSFVGVYYYDVGRTEDWILCARSSTPLPAGQYGLVVKMGYGNSRFVRDGDGRPQRYANDASAPTLYYRYIESPDGKYTYPLFASQEEAEFESINDTANAMVFPDDPSATTWWRPAAPAYINDMDWTRIQALLADPKYTRIPTEADHLHAPVAFPATTVSGDEFSTFNYLVETPGEFTHTVAVSGLPQTLAFDPVTKAISGTLPEVAFDNVFNPKDTYNVIVTRTNAYGSSQGTLSIDVVNTTMPVTPVSGFTWDSATTPLVDSDTLGEGSAVDFDNALDDGKRYIFPKAWVEAHILPALVEPNDKVFLGVHGGDATAEFDYYIEFSYQGFYHRSSMQNSVALGNGFNYVDIMSFTDAYYDYAFELDGGDLHIIGCNALDLNTQPAVNAGGAFSRIWSNTGLTGPLTLTLKTSNTEMDISLTDLVEIDIPTPSSPSLTTWSKALRFTGGSKHSYKVDQSVVSSPLRMGGATVAVPTTIPNFTSDDQYAFPWATAIVFRSDGNNSNQHIWNAGEGQGGDNIYIRTDPSGNYYFGWGRDGEVNECLIDTYIGQNQWNAIYVAHNGARFTAADATPANLAGAFQIKVMSSVWANPWENVGPDLSQPANWVTTGARMDRNVNGRFYVGGRGGNRSFHGKVASMVVTTLLNGAAMPTNAEIKQMIVDPNRWLQDYKVGTEFRYAANQLTWGDWQIGGTQASWATQVWLMGDGASDAYALIRNQSKPEDQNHTALRMVSMVSSDIQTVSIPGL